MGMSCVQVGSKWYKSTFVWIPDRVNVTECAPNYPKLECAQNHLKLSKRVCTCMIDLYTSSSARAGIHVYIRPSLGSSSSSAEVDVNGLCTYTVLLDTSISTGLHFFPVYYRIPEFSISRIILPDCASRYGSRYFVMCLCSGKSNLTLERAVIVVYVILSDEDYRLLHVTLFCCYRITKERAHPE